MQTSTSAPHSTGQGHETVNFEDQEVKGHRDPFSLARYLNNCPMNFNQIWQTHVRQMPFVPQQARCKNQRSNSHENVETS